MIPVNLITGFLGVGKTTLIKHLLRQHPGDQRWAVLVNEFGEVGVDGSLLESEGVAIEEVAGGCLCCVAAPAFTVGLNRLIREHRPDRILIEPSGLGHPAQVLDTLRSPIYQQVLEVQATVCVMDARHLDSPRHRAHPNFIDQIHLADILVANKADRYSSQNEQAFMQFAAALTPLKSRLLITRQGKVDPAILMNEGQRREAVFPEAHAFLLQQENEHEHGSMGKWVIAEGHGDGYEHVTWRIDKCYRFQRERLLPWLDRLNVERAKGIFRCDHGWISYNRSEDASEIEARDPSEASVLQVIDHQALNPNALDSKLREQLEKA